MLRSIIFSQLLQFHSSRKNFYRAFKKYFQSAYGTGKKDRNERSACRCGIEVIAKSFTDTLDFKRFKRSKMGSTEVLRNIFRL